MKILITGICGFAGSSLARSFCDHIDGVQVFGIDNLIRRGSETNLALLQELGCRFVHGDIRIDEDLSELPKMDWIVDCAANPSVLAGTTGGVRQVVSHNLIGTLNLLEKCRRDEAGLVMLSSSRVYSIGGLNSIPLIATGARFEVADGAVLPWGMTPRGVTERFSTASPVSIYGATKLSSEIMALEYGCTYGFPVRINRCGVIAGPGQFGRADQGIFSYWIYRWLQQKPVSYIGFGGEGLQVRDLLAPADLATLLITQIRTRRSDPSAVINVGGGIERSMSLKELSDFCQSELGPNQVSASSEQRQFDIPYYVTDASQAAASWNWKPQEPVHQTLLDIVSWAKAHQSQLNSFSG